MIEIMVESSGDVILYKFLLIFMDKDINYPDDYDDYLNAYFIKWSYKYNRYTRDTDDRLKDHASVIDSLPDSLKHQFRKGNSAWGKTDWYKDDIRFFISNEDNLSTEQVNYIKNKCKLNMVDEGDPPKKVTSGMVQFFSKLGKDTKAFRPIDVKNYADGLVRPITQDDIKTLHYAKKFFSDEDFYGIAIGDTSYYDPNNEADAKYIDKAKEWIDKIKSIILPDPKPKWKAKQQAAYKSWGK